MQIDWLSVLKGWIGGIPSRIFANWFLLIVSGIVLFLGACVYTVYASDQIVETQSQWPTVLGTIQNSRLEERSDNEVYIVVNFEYMVENVSYLGKQEWFVGTKSFGLHQQMSDEAMSEYSIGSKMPVHYNPRNPKKAVINFSQTQRMPIMYWTIYILLFLGGFCLIGLGIYRLN